MKNTNHASIITGHALCFRAVILTSLVFMLSCGRAERRERDWGAGHDTAALGMSAFEWGRFFMTIVPVDVSAENEPAEWCVYEMDFDRDWISDPMQWNWIAIRNINPYAFDEDYISDLQEKVLLAEHKMDWAQLLESSCQTKWAPLLCLPPVLGVRALDGQISSFRIRMKGASAGDALDALSPELFRVERAEDYLMALDRLKKLPLNRDGRSCLGHKPQRSEVFYLLDGIVQIFDENKEELRRYPDPLGLSKRGL